MPSFLKRAVLAQPSGTFTPMLKVTCEQASALDALRATALGRSLDEDGATWTLTRVIATAYATHLVLRSGRAELRVALAGGEVVAEDWRVRTAPPKLDADAVAEAVSDLVSAMGRVDEDCEGLMQAIGAPLYGDSGAHERWALAFGQSLVTLQHGVNDLQGVLQELETVVDDAAEEETAP